jgi:hypothetical protein
MQNVKNLKIILSRVVQDFKLNVLVRKKKMIWIKNEKLSLQKV